jgi:squalene-hopene/tetraprenyl-beta-curcumene cyclase
MTRRSSLATTAAGAAAMTFVARAALRLPCIVLAAICSATASVGAGQRTTQPATPAASRSDEPLLERLSASKASEYLDTCRDVAENRCFACHGSYAYLLAAPILSSRSLAHRQTRSAMERSIETLPAAEPNALNASDMRPVEAVMTAAVLAQNDAATTARLHPLTRKALDRMWEFQQVDGGWKWAKLKAPPSEVDDHFGVTMAAIGAGIAPERYALTPKAQEGLKKIRGYLRDHPPPTMHNRAMLMLAAAHVEGLMTDEQRAQVKADLFALQQHDGGWAMASLGNWKRSDGQPQDLISSDGYGTGFATYVLRSAAGIPAEDPRLRRAVIWMKTHQRASGRWFTRSPRKNDEFSTYAGTVYVVLALFSCGEIPSSVGSP